MFSSWNVLKIFHILAMAFWFYTDKEYPHFSCSLYDYLLSVSWCSTYSCSTFKFGDETQVNESCIIMKFIIKQMLLISSGNIFPMTLDYQRGSRSDNVIQVNDVKVINQQNSTLTSVVNMDITSTLTRNCVANNIRIRCFLLKKK